MFLVVATLAKFERRLIIERTMAVLDVARACGDTSKRLGLPAEKVAAIQAVASIGHSLTEVCKALLQNEVS